jgi:hypothetical protein
MRLFRAVSSIAAIALVLYVTAALGGNQAGPPTRKQFAALQKQVRTLQRRTMLLRSQVVWTLQMIETAQRDGETCFAALTADEFQNTWSQIDHLAVSLGAPPTFGTQTAIDDKNACEGLSVPRPPLNPSVAPTVAPFRSLILWFNP